MITYRVEIPVFSGPLDLLLHLIERDELDITAVSLAQVTEQYLTQIEQFKEQRVDELIDFLSVGARLVLIKSRALLPRPTLVSDVDDEGQDPAELLLRQLRTYRRFKEAALWLDRRQREGLRSYLRVASPPRIEGKLDLSGVSVSTLRHLLVAILRQQEVLEDSLSVAKPRLVTIEDQIGRLRDRLRVRRPFYFDDLLKRTTDSTEVAVTLLALLELIKRREARAQQARLFGPIEIDVADGDTTGP